MLIPRAVLDELGHLDAPKAVAEWLLDLPRWIEVRKTSASPDAALADFDLGEREAIQLAQEQRADLLLIDERRGLATTGTLGVLLADAQKGLIDAAAAYQQLTTKTNFRCSPELRDSFLQRVRTLGKSCS